MPEKIYTYDGPLIGVLPNGQTGLLRPSCLSADGVITLSGLKHRPGDHEPADEFWKAGLLAPKIFLQDWGWTSGSETMMSLQELVEISGFAGSSPEFRVHAQEIVHAETEPARQWKLFDVDINISTGLMSLSYLQPETKTQGRLVATLSQRSYPKAFSLRFDVDYEQVRGEILHKLYFQFRSETQYGRELLLTEWRHGHPMATMRLYPDTDTIMSDDLEGDETELLARIQERPKA